MPHPSPATFTGSDAVELAVVERSGFIESRHLGAAVVLAPDGSIARSLGPVTEPVFGRSSLKPIQAATSIALGADLHGTHAALATASHVGTEAHVAVVREILSDGGLTADDLRCPPSWPIDSQARSALAASGGDPDRLHMNCSGKHAAMLRACRAQGWTTADYLDPAHPLQRAIATNLERVAGEPITHTGTDGCGAPVFATTLVGLARMIQQTTTAQPTSSDPLTQASARIVAAVRDQPWTIDGEGRDDTVLIDTLGVFSKGGAEGVLVLCTPDGYALALKVLDGSPRARAVVALSLLAGTGALGHATLRLAHEKVSPPVLGGGAVVGAIRATV